ncbi:DUF4129 domain-containing protein [Halorubrum vacuolatum]|uniref:Protein-glutamine gamma-glutamyltransferase-like C-terminal domain-containing protein n=1 Tax=Halorubrum vacuolatum TaxID=63740 RepID=A0A238W204_HALVU|nr:DUF4129 domain-containing protein [Halorubrum vacuolatum]SNR40153.1 protein of unknown function [Halorubrum vacuolatum]
MNRESIVTLLLALLVVVALGVAAATLDTAVTTNGGGFGGGETPEGAVGEDAADETGLGAEPGGSTDFSFGGICYPWLAEPPAILVLLALFTALGWLARRDTGSLFAGTVVAVTVALPVGLVWAFLAFCPELEIDPQISFADGDDDDDAIFDPGGGVPGIGGDGEAVSTPEALFLLVVVAALIVSLLALLATRGDDEDDGVHGQPDHEEGDTTTPDLAAVGRAAGEAADRIESGAAENEVYRAWREMTEVLDIDRPASSTPGEFATAAIDAGVQPEPVEELTAVFERVRYGGADPTGDREHRAVEALRRIEATHGEDGEKAHTPERGEKRRDDGQGGDP